MASRDGPIVTGTDGKDFLHRETVASHYKVSATNKGRLRACFGVHVLLFFVMIAKLSADILDRLDVFIWEIEVLVLPKPLAWEYLWAVSFLFIYWGNHGNSKNNIRSMRIFQGGIVVFGLGMVLFAILWYFNDVLLYVSTGSTEGIQIWQSLICILIFLQGYPYGLLWYVFLAIALQIHAFSLVFSQKLINAWKARGTLKKAQ
ncbi:unnamed protein product [Darwinula stevensoni]|uniref:Uncharacterized protein n=1 Tax=Darwinula stevensoni TaxID=69355 RepID=A0A7R8X3Z4_9CRUS|nr:unnamed protein product [Darwinula stevensoni]CAG0878584.1 unnamed protein product [Darwinula stevensoni]